MASLDDAFVQILQKVAHSDSKANAVLISEAVRELTMCFAQRSESNNVTIACLFLQTC